MIIKDNIKKTVEFDNVKIGEVIRDVDAYSKELVYLIKIEEVFDNYVEGSSMNAVNLENGTLHYISPSDYVVVLEAELVVK